MDKDITEKEKKRSSPNCFSEIFICWICPVLFKGNRREVEEDDLIVPSSKTYDSDFAGEKLERYWLEELESASNSGKNPSLWRAIRRAYWLTFMPAGLLTITNAAAKIGQTLIFSVLLSYWSADSDMRFEEACYYAAGLIGIIFVSMLTHHHNTLYMQRFSMRIKVSCTAIMYRKLLRMSQASAGEVAAGRIVNLMSNDVARFDYSFMFMHHIWTIPVQSVFILYFLWQAAGYAPYVGLFGVVLILMPVQVALTKLTSVYRRKTAVRTDKRIKLMSEIINGIQVIKMYAWEKPFRGVVQAARQYEMATLSKALYIRSVFISFMLFAERSMLFVTCLVLVLTDNLIDATTIYPIQQFFSLLNSLLTMILPMAIATISEMMVSLERIQEVLMMEEREDLSLLPKDKSKVNPVLFNGKTASRPTSIVPKKYDEKDEAKSPLDVEEVQRKSVIMDYSVQLHNVSASWTNSSDPGSNTLKNITMRVRKGKFCAIIGPVGSGKTSILQLILKELPITSGTLNVSGKISYASQEAWLFPGTVRDNILFGLPYDSQKYKQVCKVCCLLPDFKQFPYGDLSLVGERGVSLSGGQRARINLARAVYRDADIYILDDPLSAVDANVGRKLFEECITGYLRGRTCILVTHQIHFLKAADTLIVLNDGRIQNMGSYEEVVASGSDFTSLLTNSEEGPESPNQPVKRPSFSRNISELSTMSDDLHDENSIAQVQEAETRSKGALKWSVIFAYLSSVQSWFLVFFTVFVLALTQGSATMVDYLLSFWTNSVDEYEQSLPAGVEPDPGLDTQIGIFTNGIWLTIFGCSVLGIIILSQIRTVSFVVTAMRASKNIHDTIFQNLIQAVMRFFDTNPSGRVLNRFSKDVGAMDEFLPRSMIETIQMYLSMTSILVLNAVALPWTLIPTAFLILLFVFYLKWYLNTAQAVKRLEGTTKSPVFSMINSTITGLSTIRSANSQDRLLRMFDNAQDIHSSAFYTFTGGSSAFGLYLDLLCLVYIASIVGLFLLLDYLDASIIPVGSVGLAISQSMVLTMMLQLAARFTADFLAQMTAVERCLEYTVLPKEENMENGTTKPGKDWPSEGRLSLNNIYLQYGADDPPVLDNLTFDIQSGWKVGVVGRTGAGKSSLISALFRLYSLEGTIKIDDLDTVDIAKQELRSKISIIPQEPVLFSATLRYNLDPFNTYSDEDIWRALEQVELKDAVPALEFKVSEGGGNFSVGQRQLICLARAILRSNKILVLDEATANVDPQTDALIQKTIRKAFANCTVITVAHRLNTIMDSDRVLVMDKGKVAEYDYPHVLLSNPKSIFSFMVGETGEKMARVLKDVAKQKYDSEHVPTIEL